MATLPTIWKRIERETTPSQGYKGDLERLRALAPGFAYCFAFRYVDADICNGGFSQLHANSTWPLTLCAQQAAAAGGAHSVARVLKEAIFYYHKAGRSRFNRQLPLDFFADMPENWNKSLSQLDDEYYALVGERDGLEQALANQQPDLFNSPSNTSLERTLER
jgi:hypothetical protein